MKAEPSVQSELSPEEKRAALDFALVSETLGRSDSLKRLLRFVCEAELSGEESHFTEYEIAVSALGRREDFSPTEDSTVRSRAFELRRKLERLYTIEAPDYPIRVDLPKGSYRPRFERIELVSEPLPPVSSVDVVPSPTLGKARSSSWWVPGAASFLVGCCVTALIMLAVTRYLAAKHSENQGLNDPRWTPELRELWSPLLSGTRPLVVVFETPLFVDVGPAVVRDRKAETMHDAETSSTITQVRHLFGVQETFEARRYTDFSVANALFSIARLASTSGNPLKAERALDLTDEDVRSSNLILLGRPGTYDGVRGISSNSRNFLIQKGQSDIVNQHPLTGEDPVYKKSGIAESAGDSEEYGIVTMTRGAAGDQHTLNLMTAESEMYGSLALYITDPVYAKDLVDHVRLSSGQLPDAFEVLVKAELKARRPIRIQYVAHRVIPSQP